MTLSDSPRIDEISDGIYRFSTPVSAGPGGFSFNQYLIVDDQPLLYHTGPRSFLAGVRQALQSVLGRRQLAFIAFSHFEADECGGLNDLLRLEPQTLPVCGSVNAMVNGDAFDRPARALAHGEALITGKHTLRWFDAPHLPHAWECGHLMDETTATLFCGDLFTQGGSDNPALTSADILGPSEAMRRRLDYYSHTSHLRAHMAPLIAARPATLACMHGSAWQGDGAQLLGALADALQASDTRA